MSSYPPSEATNGTTGGQADGQGGGGGGGPGGGPGGPSPDETLVFWLDIALLCAVGVFFLAFLPRMIGRFSNFSEWTRGLILRSCHVPPTSTMAPMQQYNQRSRAPAAESQQRLYRSNTQTTYVGRDGTFDQSHTLANHMAYAYPGTHATNKSRKEWSSMPSGNTRNPPVHFRTISSLFYPFSKAVTLPVTPTKSFGKALILVAYVAGLLFVTFYNGGNPLTDSDRAGYIAISQIPVAVALGTKNNVVGMLLGMGYERLNYLHRAAGVASFIAATVHALGYIYKWAINDRLAASFEKDYVIWGTVGLGGVSMLYFTSIPSIRQKFYTFFLYSHIAGYVLYFVGICYHESVCVKWVILALVIYGLDHLFRVIKTRVTTARLVVMPELGLTRIELPRVGSGWRAGQHVRLRLVSGEMGLFGWSVAHPFTIANASDSDAGRGLVLLCKKCGGWTSRLYAAASRAGAFGYEEGQGTQRIREMKVIVEGPYGGLGNTVMSSYSSTLLVTGGSGITFGIGQAEELVQNIIAERSAIKFIELIWVTQEKSSLGPMIPTFANLLGSVANLPGVILRITVHYTRAEKKSVFAHETKGVFSSGGTQLDAHLATLAPNLTLHSGRPSVPRTLSSICSLTSSMQDAKGLAVGVCGPIGLVHEVQKAVRNVDGGVRNACGGIDLHEELFGW